MRVRRLAAIDMHGWAGTPFRQRAVLAEYGVAALAGLGLGLWGLAGSTPAGWKILGAYVLGIGLNYVVLTAQAVQLLRPGALRAELSGLNPRVERVRYSLWQLWLAVPLSMVALEAWDTRWGRRVLRLRGGLRQPGNMSDSPK